MSLLWSHFKTICIYYYDCSRVRVEPLLLSLLTVGPLDYRARTLVLFSKPNSVPIWFGKQNFGVLKIFLSDQYLRFRHENVPS